jgi:hypothetical protein
MSAVILPNIGNGKMLTYRWLAYPGSFFHCQQSFGRSAVIRSRRMRRGKNRGSQAKSKTTTVFVRFAAAAFGP